MNVLLSFTTWLAPGLPYDLFDAIARVVSVEAGESYELTVEPKISGPTRPGEDLFSQGLTDIGFLCPPSYVWLRRPDVSSAVLAPVAPVFDDPRNRGRPVYYSDLVVAVDSGIRSLADLRGARVGYNDRSSLSGYFGLLHHLDQHGLDTGFFGSFRPVGSHFRALDLIADGRLDAAAIDTNVRRHWLAANPNGADRIRRITDIGPHPVQPIVMGSNVADRLMPSVIAALTGSAVRSVVAPFGVIGFASIADADFDRIEPMMSLDSQTEPRLESQT
jgi:phosphonate transport system substrate-binding protein